MKNRMLILTVVALALSVGVAYYAYRLLESRLSPSDETTQIVVALEKLPLGSRLTEQQLRLTPWPTATPLEGSFADPKEVVGRGVVVSMSANEPVLESKLAPREAGAGLTTTIPEGMRAVSVKVNDVIGVAGFVTPGTRVDVIAIGSPNGEGKANVSKVFLENVQVLAAGQNVQRDDKGQPQQNVQVVTLLVSPEDSQKLALATDSKSRIQLSLRNPMDQVDANPSAVNQASLYGPSSGYSDPSEEKPKPRVERYRPRKAMAIVAAAPVVTPPPPPPRRTLEVEVIKGDKREKSTFEEKRP
jgi:pilus assembly protein CpaB